MKRIFYFIYIFMFISTASCNNLTMLEKNWIKENPIIKVGIDSNWPPFDFVDKNGAPQGISSEYLRIITKETGLEFDIVASDWTDILKLIKDKKIDILSAAVPTKNRKEYLNFSDSYLDLDLVVLAKKDLKIKSFNEISKYKVVVQENNFIHDILKKRFPSIKFIFVKSNLDAFKAVSYGKADIFIGNVPVITYFKQKELLTNLEVKFKADIQKANLSVAILKENSILYNIIQKVLQDVNQKQKDEINNKWIFAKKNSLKINYSKDELAWMKQNRLIKIAGDPLWAPFSFYENGKYIGIIPDMIALIESYSDLKFQYVNTKEWKQSVQLLEEKKISLIDGIATSRRDDKSFNVSNEYLTSDIVIIGNKDESYISSILQIQNPRQKKVGVIEDYTVTKNIKKNKDFLSKLVYYKSSKEAMLALSHGLIDYFIIDIPTFEYYSKRYSLSNLKILGPTGFHNSYGLAVKKDEVELLSIINKALKIIPQDKKDEVYRKWIKIQYEEKIDYDLIWKIILGFFIILSASIYWNRKLKISTDFINSIMDSQDSIVIVSDGKNIKKANKAFFDFTQYKNLEEFKEEYSCVSSLFVTSKLKNYLSASKHDITWVNKLLCNPKKNHMVLMHKDNKAHIFKVSASKISEQSSLITAVFTDITKLEELSESLRKTKDEAIYATKQKSEFLANMSHEIRTPMNSVIGFTELLDKEITNEVQRDYLSSIKKGGNALLQIINDILDLSKIEAGKFEIKNESISPKNLFFDIKSIFESKILSKNINFSVSIDKNIPDYIIVDSIRLRQILFNLIGNAIKFTDNGYIKLNIKNIYKDKARSKIDLVISVEDSGIGIEKKYQKNIFNSFEQQKNQSVEKYGGTGLGLAICSKLVKMMNGKISVLSEKNEGSTFTIILKNIAVSSISDEPLLEKLNVDSLKFAKATLLVVDDILENRNLVKQSLKNYDFEIIMAVDGQDAINKLNNVNVDLILMDLRMPNMNGYEAASIIKNNEKLKHIPLLALTASVMEKDLEKTSLYGFDSYLRKPVILDDLISEISKYLKHETLELSLKPNETKDENISKNDLEKLVTTLEEKILIDFDSLKNSGDFLLIDEFYEYLKELAEKNDLNILKDYSKELKKNIDSFDIERVDFMLNSFPALLNKIKSIR